jgi:hypothetical protein
MCGKLTNLFCCALLLQELEEEWEKAKPLLKEVLRAAGWTATADSSYDEYLEALAAWQQQQQDGAAADGELNGPSLVAESVGCWACMQQQQRARGGKGLAGTSVGCNGTAKGSCKECIDVLAAWQQQQDGAAADTGCGAFVPVVTGIGRCRMPCSWSPSA